MQSAKAAIAGAGLLILLMLLALLLHGLLALLAPALFVGVVFCACASSSIQFVFEKPTAPTLVVAADLLVPVLLLRCRYASPCPRLLTIASADPFCCCCFASAEQSRRANANAGGKTPKRWP